MERKRASLIVLGPSKSPDLVIGQSDVRQETCGAAYIEASCFRNNLDGTEAGFGRLLNSCDIANETAHRLTFGSIYATLRPINKRKTNAAKAAKAQAKKVEIEAVKESTLEVNIEVEIGAEAQAQFDKLPLPIQGRVRKIFKWLKEWPAVSGAKPLTGDYAGSFRIRTGDYRIVIKPVTKTKIKVWKIGDRKDVYVS